MVDESWAFSSVSFHLYWTLRETRYRNSEEEVTSSWSPQEISQEEGFMLGLDEQLCNIREAEKAQKQHRVCGVTWGSVA